MYQDGDAREAKLLCAPVAAFVARVQDLLREFPEHAILEQLVMVAQRLMAMPLSSPLGRLLAGLELLHRKALEWEGYAAAHVSVRTHVHEPIRQGNCTGCHDPHGSDQPNHSRRACALAT